MADTVTTNYSLTKPEVGASGSTWGNKLNSNMDVIDSTLKEVQDDADAAVAAVAPVSTVANAALPKAGGTMTGPINMGAQNISNAGSGAFTSMTISGSAVWHVGNFNPALYAALTGANFSGTVQVKNSFPQFEWWETDGAADNRRLIARVEANVFSLSVVNDLGTVPQRTPLTVSMVDGAVSIPGYLSTSVRIEAQGSIGNNAIGIATASQGSIEIRGNGTGAAFLALHRPGAFGTYLGLDTDNKLKLGGWSFGAVAYDVWNDSILSKKQVSRAWARFTVSAGTPSLQKSHNIASITDHGIGDFTFNFTTAMSDALYAINCTGDVQSGVSQAVGGVNRAAAPTTAGFRCLWLNPGIGAIDPVYASVSVYGDM